MVNSLLDLPDDALTGILAKLPLKALITANCVCKTFHRLISPLHSSHVIALHSANASPILLYEHFEFDKDSRLYAKRYFYLLDPRIDIDFGRQIRSAIPFDPDWKKFRMSNSCNGLVYLTYIRALHCRYIEYVEHSVVWNPLTNEYLELHTKEKGYHDIGESRELWLGFSPGSNQYKVLKTWSGGPNVTKGRLLDIGSNSNSWRAVGETHSIRWRCQDRFPTYLDGVIYWTILDTRTHQFAIVFFDFDREEFGVMDLNDVHYDNSQLLMISLGMYQGCLRLSCYFSEQRLVMWVMEKGNWGRKFVVDMVREHLPDSHRLLKPLHVLRNGEILMFSGNFGEVTKISCFNPKTNSLRRVKVFRCPIYKGFNLIPTFVPLKDILKVDNIKLLEKTNR